MCASCVTSNGLVSTGYGANSFNSNNFSKTKNREANSKGLRGNGGAKPPRYVASNLNQ